MHEYSIVQALLDKVDATARAHGAVAVARVRLAIGRLAGVDSELLRSAFELVRSGTSCATAELDVRVVEARWVCRRCGVAVLAGGVLRCQACGEPVRLEAGDEIILESLELELG